MKLIWSSTRRFSAVRLRYRCPRPAACQRSSPTANATARSHARASSARPRSLARTRGPSSTRTGRPVPARFAMAFDRDPRLAAFAQRRCEFREHRLRRLLEHRTRRREQRDLGDRDLEPVLAACRGDLPAEPLLDEVRDAVFAARPSGVAETRLVRIRRAGGSTRRELRRRRDMRRLRAPARPRCASGAASATGSGAVAWRRNDRARRASRRARPRRPRLPARRLAAGFCGHEVMRPNSNTTIVKITLSRSAYEISHCPRGRRRSTRPRRASRERYRRRRGRPASLNSTSSTRGAHELRDRRRRARAATEDHVADIGRMPGS